MMAGSPAPLLRLAHAADYAPRIVEIALDDIYDGDRLREIDPAWAGALAANFEAGGKPPPIEVRVPAADEGIAQPYALVVGGHRISAFRLLGRTKIRAEIRDLTRLQARLVEVEENLFRHELNALDRAIFLSEHEKVWRELNPDRVRGGDRKSQKSQNKIKPSICGFDPRHFTETAAERCGLSRATVERALALVKALAPEAISLVRGTDTARNASELQRLAAEPAERQVEIARQLREGKAKSVANARIAAGVAPTGEGDEQEDLFRRACSIYARLDTKQKRRFHDHIGVTARERTPRERMPKVSEIVPERAGGGHDAHQLDIEDAIALAPGGRSR